MDRDIWQKRFAAAIDMTRAVSAEAGWPFKEPVEIEYGECECPLWIGGHNGTGRLIIDPNRDDPEAAAHELGHGIHEGLRENDGVASRIETGQRSGEQFAQMVRRRVGKLLGRDFPLNQDAELFAQFGDDWGSFTAWVNGASC